MSIKQVAQKTNCTACGRGRSLCAVERLGGRRLPSETVRSALPWGPSQPCAPTVGTLRIAREPGAQASGRCGAMDFCVPTIDQRRTGVICGPEEKVPFFVSAGAMTLGKLHPARCGVHPGLRSRSRSGAARKWQMQSLSHRRGRHKSPEIQASLSSRAIAI
jgi:hypothetical protein